MSDAGAGALLALPAALLLGIRHATDPDHLTAVATLLLSERRRRDPARYAGGLGLAWGLGHAVTLTALGLPVLLLGRHLPDAVHRGAEVAVGAVIVLLAARLLIRWRRGSFHVHAHSHGERVHAHPHFHEHASLAGHPEPHRHDHAHGRRLGRSPSAAFGVGLIHGVGGSAGVGLLLVASLPSAAARTLALVVFAMATAMAMGVVSLVAGHLVARGAASGRLERAVPVLGGLGVLFGMWYALAGAGALP